MSFLIITNDNKGQIRAFHAAAFADVDIQSINKIIERKLRHIDALEAIAERVEERPAVKPPNGAQASHEAMKTQAEMARDQGFTGNSCPQCHGLRMLRTGVCVTCQDCSYNEGCG